MVSDQRKTSFAQRYLDIQSSAPLRADSGSLAIKVTHAGFRYRAQKAAENKIKGFTPNQPCNLVLVVQYCKVTNLQERKVLLLFRQLTQASISFRF